MRRGFSIFLILLFGFGPLTVFIDSEDVNLPVCCRGNGKHHCAMAMRMVRMMRQMQSGKTPVISPPVTCPDYPGAATAFSAPPPALTVNLAEQHVFAEMARVDVKVQTAPLQVPNRTHAGRGPPAVNQS